VEEIVQHFLRACVGDDMSALLGLLAPDVTLTPDNGGKVSSIRNIVAGADRVARLMLGTFRRWSPPLIYYIALINGQPALVGCAGRQPVSVTTFDVRDSKIEAIYQVLNPDKLKGLACGSDLGGSKWIRS
jgi:RNA polymerase sigma-70 factor (ECF subfamily)